jgi:hypothetical protein
MNVRAPRVKNCKWQWRFLQKKKDSFQLAASTEAAIPLSTFLLKKQQTSHTRIHPQSDATCGLRRTRSGR